MGSRFVPADAFLADVHDLAEPVASVDPSLIRDELSAHGRAPQDVDHPGRQG